MESIKLDLLKPNPDNPRYIKDENFEKLVQSIIRFPKMMKARPMVIDENSIILGGNMRDGALIEICKRAKLQVDIFEDYPEIRELILKEEIPASWVKKISDLTEEEKKEFIIKDNIGFGQWDWDILANEYEDSLLVDWGLDLSNFMNDTIAPEVDIEEDSHTEPKNLQIDVVQNDLIEFHCQDGRVHKLLTGSALSADNWSTLIEMFHIRMLITTTPKEKTIEKDYDYHEGIQSFIYDYYSIISSYTDENAPFYHWIDQTDIVAHIFGTQEAQIDMKQHLIWLQNKPQESNHDYKQQHELCLYGTKEGEIANWHSNDKQSSILKFDRKGKRKPVALIAQLISNSTEKNDLVADGFADDGTTMVAAHQLNRVCYAMEPNEKKCQVIIDRMLELDEDITVKINGEIYEKQEA